MGIFDPKGSTSKFLLLCLGRFVVFWAGLFAVLLFFEHGRRAFAMTGVNNRRLTQSKLIC